jgi:hypothetical protein
MTDVGDVQLRAIGVAGYGDGASGYGQAGAYGLVPAIVVDPDGQLFAQAAREVHQMWAQFFEQRGW